MAKRRNPDKTRFDHRRAVVGKRFRREFLDRISREEMLQD